MSPPTTSDYLPHLDGLRAIALAGVLLFHFEVAPFTGGFSGVDVFLSLSGYLITRNILRQQFSNQFSLRAFYSRRFFRLYPASTITTLVTIIFVYLFFQNDNAHETSQSALASMLLSSNIFFHLNTGYFNTEANLRPLLHTWSLSLEEQFYFIWAPLTVLISKMSPHANRFHLVVSIILIILIAFSIGIGQILHIKYPTFTFFELPARLFQFAAGALLAVLLYENASSSPSKVKKTETLEQAEAGPEEDHHSRINVIAKRCKTFLNTASRTLMRELTISSALAGIAINYIYVPETASPMHMFPITLCTCIVIAMSNTFISSKILSSTVFVVIGRISYSAYLVHWPLYVFTHYFMAAMSMGKPNPIFMTLLTLICATLLKRGVEDPIRTGDIRNRRAFALVAILTLLLTITGVLTDGFSFRDTTHPDPGDILAGKYHVPQDPNLMCGNLRNGYMAGYVDCLVGPRGAPQADVYFFGDSYMLHLSPALLTIAIQRNVTYWMGVGLACPLFAKRFENLAFERAGGRCHIHWKEQRRLLDDIPPNSSVVIAHRWQIEEPDLLRENVIALQDEFQHLGHDFTMITEVPGIDHDIHESYLACRNLVELPAGRGIQAFMKLLSHEVSGCTLDINNHPPVRNRGWQSVVQDKAFVKGRNNSRIVNLVAQLCKNDSSTPPKMGCHLPRGSTIEDMPWITGYYPDGHHLAAAGGFWLTDIFEQGVFQTQDASKFFQENYANLRGRVGMRYLLPKNSNFELVRQFMDSLRAVVSRQQKLELS